MLVVLSPGQGSQSPGMLRPWLDLPGARERVDRWSELTGLDLLTLGTTADEAEIRDTAVAQPLLASAALLSADAVLDGALLDGRADAPVWPDAVCGHSIGELPALAVAGVLDADTAVRLAAERGAAMARAAAEQSTGMVAVLGGRDADVRAAAERYGLDVANVNVEGQLVLGGPVEALDAFTADAPERARVRRLAVAGAFHTEAMRSAIPGFREVLNGVTPGSPRCTVVANADGAVVADGAALIDRLVTQLTSSVRFDLCLRTLADLGVSAVVELAPGGTLAALAKRGLPAVPVVALRSPDDVPAARALLSAPVAS